MHSKWKSTADNMKNLTRKYLSAKQLPPSQIHKDILIRAMKLLSEAAPEAETLIRPQLGTMLPYTVRADKKGDRENGMGRHYYCACTTGGTLKEPFCGYFRNGRGCFAKSARTMFEEDYTMALTMHCSGFVRQGAVYLARAVHLLSDMCCLPHAAGMTYFSSKRRVHTAYERLARAMYPEFVPEQHTDYDELRRFAMRSSFSSALNRTARSIIGEFPELHSSPEAEIKKRLYDTEKAAAAILYRFYRDTLVPPLRSHCAADGMTCRLFSDMPPLNVRVTEHGITFELAGMPVNSEYGSFFRVAHRRNGLFSISPVNSDGLVLSRQSRKPVRFDPSDPYQLYFIK